MGLDAKMRSHGLIRCDRKRAASSLTGSPIQCVESLKSYIVCHTAKDDQHICSDIDTPRYMFC